MSFTTDHNPAPAQPWGIPATIAWLLFAFLASVVVATAVFAAWQGDRANIRPSTYDGVMITIGALASVPVQIAVLAVAARLRRWTPADYFVLSWAKRANRLRRACIASNIVFDTLLVSGRDLACPVPDRGLSTPRMPVADLAAAGHRRGCADRRGDCLRGFLYRGFARPG
jgi:hypothetical protein